MPMGLSIPQPTAKRIHAISNFKGKGAYLEIRIERTQEHAFSASTHTYF